MLVRNGGVGSGGRGSVVFHNSRRAASGSGFGLLLTTSMSWDKRSPSLTVSFSVLLPTGRINLL